MTLKVILVVVSALLGFLYSGRASLDATSIAIVLPMVILISLILIAYKKRQKSIANPLRQISKSEFIICSVFAFVSIFAVLCLYTIGLLDQTSLALGVPESVLLTLIFMALIIKSYNPNLALYSKSSTVSMLVFKLAALCTFLLWISPLLYFLLTMPASHSTLITKELYRICTSLSAFSSCAMGFAVVMIGKDVRLNLDSLFGNVR